MASEKQDSWNFDFNRDGKPLSFWLWRLLDEEKETRLNAGEHLQSMNLGVETGSDWEQMPDAEQLKLQEQRFAAEVKRAVNDESFDTESFVRQLCAYKQALQEGWNLNMDAMTRQMEEQDARFQRLSDPVLEELKTAETDEQKERLEGRFAWMMKAYIGTMCNDDIFSEAELTSSAGLAAGQVFNALDVELLAAPDVLDELLGSELRSDALEAVNRMGTAGSVLIPRLTSDLEDQTQNQESPHRTASTLGAIGRGDSAFVQRVLQDLKDGDAHRKDAAISSVLNLGTEICGMEREFVDTFWTILGTEQEGFRTVEALASVGRDIDEVQNYLIQRATDGCPFKKDASRSRRTLMWERGTALKAMSYLAGGNNPDAAASLCIPVFIDALESFEEYDPDYEYGGPAGRVCEALQPFGPAAGPLAPFLGPLLEGDLEEYPVNILDALKAMGTAAAPALPGLRALWLKVEDDDESPPANLDAEPVDPSLDPLGAWIQSLSRESEQFD